MRTRPGLALLLVVGVLGILAVLGTAFAVLSRLERRSAAQRAASARALLLARSGLEDAAARLDAGQDPAYGGEDWDVDGLLGGIEVPAESYRPGILDRESCPVRHALRPSFFVQDRDSLGADLKPAPKLVSADGRDRGRSGGAASGFWTLRALPQGGFHVNGGDPAQAPAAGDYNSTLRRILGTLAEALDRADGVNDGLPVNQTDGERLVDLRPRTPRGWESFGQVRSLALGGSQARLDALEPYLALSAWVDRKVVAPKGPAGIMQTDSTWDGFKSLYSSPVPGCRAPDFERIGGRVVGRAPVDFSWARRRRPALIALLAGLKGSYLDEGYDPDGVDSSIHTLGMLRDAEIVLNWSLATDDCRRVADQVLACTSEIRTWQAFDALCDGLTVDNGSVPPFPASLRVEYRQAKRDVLKSAFNPNTDLNKLNPDRSLARSVDKSDLKAYSTELNLLPRSGWRVSSVGRVLDAHGRVQASRTLSMELAHDPIFRLTTQSEMTAASLGDPLTAGDESAFRGYADSPYITPSAGVGKTFGHRLFGDPGVSLQTYPEPHTVWTPPATGRPACFDGQLKLATVEAEDRETYLTASSMMFLARWDDGFDADFSDSGSLASVSPPDTAQRTPATPVWGDLPGKFLPDGIYAEKGGQPGYPASGSMAASHGAFSVWAKPMCQGGQGRHGRTYFNNTRDNGNPLETACMMFGNLWTPDMMNTGRIRSDGFAMIVENEYREADSIDHEHIRLTPMRQVLRHRWHLVSFLWAMDQTSVDKGARILVDRGEPAFPGDRNSAAVYASSSTVQGPPIDFTQQAGGAFFYIGSRGQGMSTDWYGYPDATLDEAVIYDFGADVDAAITASEVLAAGRYAAGRYYKESEYPASGGLLEPPGAARNAGEWFSAPLELGEARLRTLSWTQIVPRDLRAPSVSAGKPEEGDDGPDGRVVLELAHRDVAVPALAGASYATDASGREIRSLFTRDAGQEVGARIVRPFRLHAVFQPNLADRTETALVDALALDDVSLAYRPLDRPLIWSWLEGES